MVNIIHKSLNLQKIAESGQCFRMFLHQGQYVVIARDRCVRIEQKDSTLNFDCTKEEYENIWYSYFDLDTNYDAIESIVHSDDLYLSKAVSYGKGIRILRQDLWEMMITFLISQQNNIPRIKKCVELICKKYGEEKENDILGTYYAFPRPEQLAKASEEELRDCNLGYRAPYLMDAARKVSSRSVDLERLKKLSYPNAKEELLTIKGIGIKVSECICLFGLHHLEAFPIDTHINKILEEHYPKGFQNDDYNKVLGALQQYMFYYDIKRQI